jgi:hypothetical protein
MKHIFHQWLDQLPAIPGVLACGVRFPDRSSMNRSWSGEFPDDALDNAWRCAADTFDVLRLHQLPERRLRWLFGRHALHCEKRADSIFLGVFTTKVLQDEDDISFKQIVADFHSVG